MKSAGDEKARALPLAAQRERWVDVVRRHRPRFRAMTRPNLVGWIGLIVAGFIYLGGGVIWAGPGTRASHSLTTAMSIWGALSAGCLALVLRAHFLLLQRVGDWASRLREVGVRAQDEALEILLRETAAEFEVTLWLRGSTAPDTLRDLELKLNRVYRATDDAWAKFLGSIGKQANNICQEIEEAKLRVPDQVHELRKLIHGATHEDSDEGNVDRRRDFRNNAWARVSDAAFLAGGIAARLGTEGAHLARPSRPPVAMYGS